MRVAVDFVFSLWLGCDLLALVVIDLVSLGLNLGKNQFVTLVQQRFLILGKVVLRYSVRNCLEVGNSWVVIWA